MGKKTPAFSQEQFHQSFVYFTVMTLAQKALMETVKGSANQLGVTDEKYIQSAYEAGADAMIKQWADWYSKGFNDELSAMKKRDFTELRIHTGVEDLEALRVAFRNTIEATMNEARRMLAMPPETEEKT